MRVCVGLAVALGFFTLAPPSAAETPAESPPSSEAEHAPAPAPPRLENRWYGWQTLATDGTAIALLAGTALVTQGAPPGPLPTTGYVLGTLSYMIGGPIVHFAHHNPGRGFLSFGLRVPVPLVAGLSTAYAFCRAAPGEYCGLIGLPVAAAGVLTAIAVDAAVLGRDTVLVDGDENRAVRLLPVVSVTPRSASLGLALTL